MNTFQNRPDSLASFGIKIGADQLIPSKQGADSHDNGSEKSGYGDIAHLVLLQLF